MRDGYVRVRYPADSDNPDGVGVVREQHLDAYLADGFTLIEDDESENDDEQPASD